jgi:malate dehydrogenase (oxaloacetate-decarboxylating)
MNINEEALKLHLENKGKIEVVSKTKIKDMHDLAVVYTPGVAEPWKRWLRLPTRIISKVL